MRNCVRGCEGCRGQREKSPATARSALPTYHNVGTALLRRFSLEAAEKIHAALDELGKLARPDDEMQVRHPGVETLASSPALLAECGVTDATLAALRSLYLIGPDGKPVIISTVASALEWAGLLQRTQRP